MNIPKTAEKCLKRRERTEKSKEVGKIEIKMLLFPNEDDVEELDGANDGESVREAQHAANVRDEGGHAVRLQRILFNRGDSIEIFSLCTVSTLLHLPPEDAGIETRTVATSALTVDRQTL